MGRCGSTVMFDFVFRSFKKFNSPIHEPQKKFLVNIEDLEIEREENPNGLMEIWKTHDPVVPLIERPDIKFVYQFAHPLNVILSTVYGEVNRSIHISRHLKVEDSWVGSNRWIYEDVLGLERHFDNWTTTQKNKPLLVSYETMWSKLPEICNYLGLPEESIEGFPEKRERKFDWNKLPEKIQKPLTKTYSSLINKIEKFNKE